MTNSPIKSLNISKIIILEYLVGEGNEEDPIRIVKRYYDLEGKLLFESDPKRNS